MLGGWVLTRVCPYIIAPEVVLKNDPVAGYGPAVDAWSIGIILFACLTNTTPFDESESTPLPQRMAARKVDMTNVREVGASEMGRSNILVPGSRSLTALTPTAIDFLQRLLTNDPRKRMTVRKCHDDGTTGLRLTLNMQRKR